MARGLLGQKILEHFAANPGPQTIKQIRDAALPGTSGGAIGYALDKLISEKRLAKIDGRPARYDVADGYAALAASETPEEKAEKRQIARRRPPETEPEDEDEEEETLPRGKKTRASYCGFCLETRGVENHMYCPEMIARARAGEDWYCSCAQDYHRRARDFGDFYKEEVEAALAAGAPHAEVMDLIRGIVSERRQLLSQEIQRRAETEIDTPK